MPTSILLGKKKNMLWNDLKFINVFVYFGAKYFYLGLVCINRKLALNDRN